MLRLERALAELRLELGERDRSLARLRGEVAKARGRAGDLAGERAQADVERLVAAIGAPLVQLVAMDQLRKTGTAELTAADVLEVGMRLVRMLGLEGVQTGGVGETQAFDPDRHDPLSMTGIPKVGEPIVVRVAALTYQGKVLRKAGVEVAKG